MWTRGYLKERAKYVLRVSYWKAFLVSIILGFAGANGGGSGGSGRFTVSEGSEGNLSFEEAIGYLILVLLILGIVLLFGLAFRIFLGYPLEVGGRRFFIENAQLEGQTSADLDTLGFAFKKERYMDIIKAMLYRGVLNFCWYLLFIIPGVIKFFAYIMVPYILAENPNIGYKRALELSNEMTYGHKLNIVILRLSFLGWYCLGFLCCCVGVAFVVPYENATMAELYLVLKNQAINKGICSRDEFWPETMSPQQGFSEFQ
jgi:hypothetical protein